MIDALPLLLSDEGYQISRSVRLRSSASAYFSRTPASASNRKTWTYSCWFKRGTLGAGQRLFRAYGGTTDADNTSVGIDSSDRIEIGGHTVNWRVSTAVLRDPSAWMHLVFVVNTPDATANNRIRVYVNGVELTAFATLNNPSQNADLAMNSAVQHLIGANNGPSSPYTDGYLTEINFIDGLTPNTTTRTVGGVTQTVLTELGEFDAVTGVWKPVRWTRSFGTKGFYLNFSDNSAATAAAIGKDNSGNGNNWTPNNISVTAGVTYDSMLDVPTQWADGGNGRGNYCVWNPIDPNALIGGGIVDGNLLGYPANTAGRGVLKGTINLPTSGQYYFEITPTVLTSAVAIIGICKTTVPYNASSFSAGDLYAYRSTPDGWNGAATITYGASYTTNDVIGVAFDASAGTITFYKNGVSQGQAYSGISGEYTPFAADQTTGGVTQYALNCGQRPFSYTPPTGFKALNTLNLPQPTILKGNQYFDATLYTGNNSTLSVTNSGSMQPDLVWIKGRSQSSNNVLQDAVRGANRYLISNGTGAEGTDGSVTAFNSNGFSLTTDAGVSFNANGTTYVGWQWKEGATQGFDIVTYTGTGSARTVAHNLGVAPAMMIIKSRSASGTSWNVYHASTGNTGAMFLDTTNAFAADSTRFNNTSPTSTNFTVGSGAGVNGSGSTFVAYLFAEVAGFSKFGSYTGNGSADGPMIFTGFQPRFVMVKRTDSTGGWAINDTARDPININDAYLAANTSGAEIQPEQGIDILSNGFKLRSNGTVTNASGGTFIYLAFASNPFKNSLAF